MCVLSENSFCNNNIFGIWGLVWEWGWKHFDETPKSHTLGWLHAFWVIMGTDTFTVSALCVRRKRGHNKVTDGLYFTYFESKMPYQWHCSPVQYM